MGTSRIKRMLGAAIGAGLMVILGQVGAARSAELKIFGSRVTKMMMADVGPQFERDSGTSSWW